MAEHKDTKHTLIRHTDPQCSQTSQSLHLHVHHQTSLSPLVPSKVHNLLPRPSIQMQTGCSMRVAITLTNPMETLSMTMDTTKVPSPYPPIPPRCRSNMGVATYTMISHLDVHTYALLPNSRLMFSSLTLKQVTMLMGVTMP